MMADLFKRMLHYTELPPAQPDSPLAREVEFYRREVGRLIAEGHEGKWLLIKGHVIIGLFDTRDAAMAEARERYLIPRQPCLVRQIQTYQRVSRVSCYLWSCPTSH
jgi:hypothetical protein